MLAVAQKGERGLHMPRRVPAPDALGALAPPNRARLGDSAGPVSSGPAESPMRLMPFETPQRAPAPHPFASPAGGGGSSPGGVALFETPVRLPPLAPRIGVSSMPRPRYQA